MIKVFLEVGCVIQRIYEKGLSTSRTEFPPDQPSRSSSRNFLLRLTFNKQTPPKAKRWPRKQEKQAAGLSDSPQPEAKKENGPFKRQREHTSSNTLLLPRFSFFTAGGQSPCGGFSCFLPYVATVLLTTCFRPPSLLIDQSRQPMMNSITINPTVKLPKTSTVNPISIGPRQPSM
jgi:hypothetical protein